MKRNKKIVVRVEDDIYENVRREAYEKHISISELVRDYMIIALAKAKKSAYNVVCI